nr:arginyl-tRNA synthetase, class Ic [Tanacetum cinerariifolium]
MLFTRDAYWTPNPSKSTFGSSSGLEESDFILIVEDAWKKEVRSNRPDFRFPDKLKNVKESLKKWSKERFGGSREKTEMYKKEAMRRLEAEYKTLAEKESLAWMEARKRWEEKENKCNNMHRQKARIKWDVGDENSKFFHSYIRRRNNKSNIRGRMVDGLWCEDPKKIKMEMARHYKTLFTDETKVRPKLCCERIEKITKEMARDLEKDFNENEVLKAIRGCGDGVLIANETMEFLKKKEKGLIFKVDFTKAYYSINWKLLLSIMRRMGFREKWCKCVDTCLRSTSMSILVNGSPTEEFGIEKGVRQGDPLSPFFVYFGGRRVNKSELGDMAKWMGCSIGEILFTYLRLPIGVNMRRINAWMPMVENLNLGKWWWRFKREGESLWVRIIKSIHVMGGGQGEVRGLGRESLGGRVWSDIVRIGEEIDGLGIEFSSSFKGSRVGVDTAYPRYYVLSLFPLCSLVSAAPIRRIFLYGYGVLVVRIAFAMWDRAHGEVGVSFGTVPVLLGVREGSIGEKGFGREKLGLVTIDEKIQKKNDKGQKHASDGSSE